MKPNSKAHNVPFLFFLLLALASLACGMADLPNPFATPTPTPTLTFTPTPTLTPTPTATFTPTATITATPKPTGVLIEEQADGSTLFTDYDNGYRLTLPQGWFVFPISPEALERMLNKVSDKNPAFKETAENFKKLDPDVIRLIALNSDTKYIVRGFASNISITAIGGEKLLSEMPVEFVTGVLEGQLESQGATVIEQEILSVKSKSGVDVGLIEFKQNAPTSTGATVKAYSRVMVFQSNEKLLMIQMAVVDEYAKELFPVMDEIASSIELLK